ncbi:hypothetical protein HDZ31DRAFT_81212 [Schizophyllum fasciatum]
MTSTQELIASVKAHIHDTDGHWGTSRFRQGTLASPVSALHFVAHQNLSNDGGEGGASPTNHWSLFLELDNHTAPECVTTNLTRKVSAAAPSGTIVATILNIIIAKGRDRYTFQPVGEGCRFWLYTLASDLAQEGILSADAKKEAQGALPLYWPYPYGTTPVERPMSEGTFF